MTVTSSRGPRIFQELLLNRNTKCIGKRVFFHLFHVILFTDRKSEVGIKGLGKIPFSYACSCDRSILVLFQWCSSYEKEAAVQMIYG